MGLLSWRWRSLSFGSEKSCIVALRKEKYPSIRIGRGKPAHGVDKLNESLNLAFLVEFYFCKFMCICACNLAAKVVLKPCDAEYIRFDVS
jgi:hypothetical protein